MASRVRSDTLLAPVVAHNCRSAENSSSESRTLIIRDLGLLTVIFKRLREGDAEDACGKDGRSDQPGQLSN